jgi:hypothetical protein
VQQRTTPRASSSIALPCVPAILGAVCCARTCRKANVAGVKQDESKQPEKPSGVPHDRKNHLCNRTSTQTPFGDLEVPSFPKPFHNFQHYGRGDSAIGGRPCKHWRKICKIDFMTLAGRQHISHIVDQQHCVRLRPMHCYSTATSQRKYIRALLLS